MSIGFSLLNYKVIVKLTIFLYCARYPLAVCIPNLGLISQVNIQTVMKTQVFYFLILFEALWMYVSHLYFLKTDARTRNILAVAVLLKF